ncbi:MAG: uroporphyrinogen-III synthase [Candidatus Bathyarchaeia archaeon]
MTSEKAKPLAGKVVAITRPEGRSQGMATLIEDLGGVPYLVPMVEIGPPREGQKMLDFINGILGNQFDLLIFLSVNSVKSLFDVAHEAGLTNRLLEKIESIRVLSIGTKTMEALQGHGVTTAHVPRRQSTAGILESLDEYDLEGVKIGVPRSSEADDALRKELLRRGAVVREVEAYTSTPPSDRLRAVKFLDDLLKGGIDVVTFTSASTARNMFAIAEEHTSPERLRERLNRVTVAAIGPKTQEALEALDVKVDVVPERHSIEALVMAIAEEFTVRG